MWILTDSNILCDHLNFFIELDIIPPIVGYSYNQLFSPYVSVFSSGHPNRSLDRFERRILDEFQKLFNDSDSFYFSYSGDLTNCLQRQSANSSGSGTTAAEEPLWKTVDDRFFVNKELLRELIDLNDSRADPFILPFIQGYVEMIYAPLNLEETESFYSDFQNQGGGGMLKVPGGDHALPDYYSIAIVSRRSRHRAGG